MNFFLGFLFSIALARAEGIVFIVNQHNEMTTMNREQIADFFLKRNRAWPDGTPVKFFDHPDSSSERRIFLRNYIQKSTRDIELYWIGQKLYTGHSAPSQVSTDAMVEIMVSRFPGAIGYVSDDYTLTRPVKKVTVEEK